VSPVVRTYQRGFTLLELIISMGLLGIVLLFASQFFISSNRMTTTIVDQSRLQEDLRNAGNLLSDEVQRAVYVFPPCGKYAMNGLTDAATLDTTCGTTVSTDKLTVSWSNFTLASSTSTSTTTLNPVGSTREWKVGNAAASAPILAMIVSPRQPTVQCRTSATVTNLTGCYTFVAYYPVLRSNLTATSGDVTANTKLEGDSANASTWVLMEYRRYLDTNLYDSTGGVETISPWGNAGCTTTTALAVPPATTGTVTTTCLPINSVVTKTPITDASDSLQDKQAESIPNIRRSSVGDKINGGVQSAFQRRMKKTVEWLNSQATTAPETASLVLDGLRASTGFQVEFPTGTVDERGVTEVRVKLQMGLQRNGSTVLIPSNGPLEFFASPRNVSGS
jgi:prepilin-type N-terminal cleavage/methylation domain-containing protein